MDARSTIDPPSPTADYGASDDEDRVQITESPRHPPSLRDGQGGDPIRAKATPRRDTTRESVRSATRRRSIVAQSSRNKRGRPPPSRPPPAKSVRSARDKHPARSLRNSTRGKSSTRKRGSSIKRSKRKKPSPSPRRSKRSRSRHAVVSAPPKAPAKLPSLSPSSRDRIDEFTREITSYLDSRSDFDDISKNEISLTARLLDLNGIRRLSDLKRLKELQRKHLIDDLRADKFRVKDYKLISDLFDIIPPVARNNRTQALNTSKHINFEEICIEAEVKKLKFDFSSPRGFLLPDQDMCNKISDQIARAQAVNPPYTPYPSADLSLVPWIPDTIEHAGAFQGWKQRSRQSKNKNQFMSVQLWMFAHLRFIIAAQLCGAWDKFGGLSSQLNHLGHVLNLSVLYGMHAGMEYHKLITNELISMARRRSRQDLSKLLDEEQVTQKRIATQDGALLVKPVTIDLKPAKGAGNGKGAKPFIPFTPENGGKSGNSRWSDHNTPDKGGKKGKGALKDKNKWWPKKPKGIPWWKKNQGLTSDKNPENPAGGNKEAPPTK